MEHKASGTLTFPPTAPSDPGTPKPTVRVKRCCGVLTGDVCDCAEQQATARELFRGRNAIMCRPASEWSV
jgi:hypothetical protein